MIIGAIDIGTGSVLCLAVRQTSGGRWEEVVNESVITALGAGTTSRLVIPEESQARTLKAVVRYVKMLRDLGAHRIVVVGTSALRRARNRGEFVARVREATGLSVEVLSGEQEAALTFRGAIEDLLDHRGPVVVMDVGGGSPEIVVGSPSAQNARPEPAPQLAVSIPLGALSLTERHILSYPPTDEQIAAVRLAIEEAIAEQSLSRIVETARRSPQDALLVAVGGTATTLVAMEKKIDPYDGSKVHLSSVSRETIARHLALLATLTLEERFGIVGLPKGRAPVIDAGLWILSCLLELFGSETMLVSDKGLRHGVISREKARFR